LDPKDAVLVAVKAAQKKTGTILSNRGKIKLRKALLMAVVKNA
jgi:hypothetical protein